MNNIIILVVAMYIPIIVLYIQYIKYIMNTLINTSYLYTYTCISYIWLLL